VEGGSLTDSRAGAQPLSNHWQVLTFAEIDNFSEARLKKLKIRKRKLSIGSSSLQGEDR
jgi:hypothetical protein